MIEGRTIVCIASAWDYDPTSKHQIMKILAERNRVLWVNYRGTRRPRWCGADFRAGLSTLRRFAGGMRRVSSSFAQLTPLVLPGARSAWAQAIHQRMLVAQIRRALHRYMLNHHGPVQVWAFAPDVPYLAGQFGEECFLYYCVDDYSLFEGLDTPRIVAAENELIDRADLVVTTSEALWRTKSVRRTDVLLARHGVDYDTFAAAWRNPSTRPNDIAQVPGPIFGFFGLIEFWVDCDLIAAVARLRPQYSFVLIGDCRIDVSALRALPNVYLLGRRANGELPAYCAAFTAGLMPFTRGALARSINPIKMHEYLAAGLPVISTPLPEAQRYAGPIQIANHPDDFAIACDRALETNQPGRRESISRLVAGESWRSKVDLLSQAVMARVHGEPLIVSKPLNDVVCPTVAEVAQSRAHH